MRSEIARSAFACPGRVIYARFPVERTMNFSDLRKVQKIHGPLPAVWARRVRYFNHPNCVGLQGRRIDKQFRSFERPQESSSGSSGCLRKET